MKIVCARLALGEQIGVTWSNVPPAQSGGGYYEALGGQQCVQPQMTLLAREHEKHSIQLMTDGQTDRLSHVTFRGTVQLCLGHEPST